MGDLPLEGLKVVDLSHYVAGPYCTKLLACAGAEVIKIEKPGEGDGARRLGPFPGDKPHPEKSGLFLYLNTGKKGITLNLKSDTGREAFLSLVKEADVLVESFAPRVMPSLGLSYQTLEELNPRLVMTSISNFGQTGPYRDYKAAMLGIHALSGEMYLAGDPDREPVKKGGQVFLYHAGLYAFMGTIAALWVREDTGWGQQVDVSIAEAATSPIGRFLRSWTYTRTVAAREREESRPWPQGGVHPCKDGYVVFTPGRGDEWWGTFKETVGLPELEDPKFDTPEGRTEHRQELDALYVSWLKDRTKEELFRLWQDTGFSYGYVATATDLLNSPQLKFRGFFQEIPHPVAGTLPYHGLPFQFSDAQLVHQRAPLLGEHNEEILCGRLGFTREDLRTLRQNGVI